MPESPVVASGARFGWPISIPILVLFFCTACSVMSGAQMASGNRWAIIVGVGRYEDASMSGRSLQYSETDAQAMYDALTTRCQVPATNAILLKGPKATKAGVEAALADIGRRAKPGDTVFFYFSGHGSYVPDKDGDEADGDRLDEVLLPYDAVLGREDTYIIDDYLGWLVSRISANSVAIIIDSCHSGGQGKSVPAPGLLAKGAGDSMVKDIFTDRGGGAGRALLSACQSGEVAFEDKDLGHGVLTFFVLQGMESREADANGDGVTSFAELGAFVEEHVSDWCQGSGTFQTPSFDSPDNVFITLVPLASKTPAVPTSTPAVVPSPTPPTALTEPVPPLHEGRTPATLWLVASYSAALAESSSHVTVVDGAEFGVRFCVGRAELELDYTSGGAIAASLAVPITRFGKLELGGILAVSFVVGGDAVYLAGGARLSYQGLDQRIWSTLSANTCCTGDYQGVSIYSAHAGFSQRVFPHLWAGGSIGLMAAYDPFTMSSPEGSPVMSLSIEVSFP